MCTTAVFHKSCNTVTQEENVMAVKYVFVTGGVVSGLGKGITAASLGRLLKARGYQVTMQKFDLYQRRPRNHESDPAWRGIRDR